MENSYIMNNTYEILCTDCDHGFYVEDIDTIINRGSVECGHCGHEQLISFEMKEKALRDKKALAYNQAEIINNNVTRELELKGKYLETLISLRSCTSNQFSLDNCSLNIDQEIIKTKKELGIPATRSVIQLSYDLAYPDLTIYPIDNLRDDIIELIKNAVDVEFLGSGSEDLTDVYVETLGFKREVENEKV